MGKSFDYERAWWEVAKPAYEALPQSVRDLYALSAAYTEGRNQQADLSIAWPEAASTEPWYDLRARFRETPAEVLALAARVIYFAGHWYPGSGRLEIPGRGHGGTWKFANLADQDLRERLGVMDRGSRTPNGISLMIHEGVIRLGYSSDDMWTWQEVAVATAEGLVRAQGLIPRVSGYQQINQRNKSDRDNRAYRDFEALKVAVSGTIFPHWPGLVHGSDLYMAEDSEIAQRREAYRTPEDREARRVRARAAIVDACAEKLAEYTRERDGKLWLFDHGWPIDNVIYYHHTDLFSFGWRTPLAASEVSAILDWISEFPYAYQLVPVEGRKLEGGRS